MHGSCYRCEWREPTEGQQELRSQTRPARSPNSKGALPDFCRIHFREAAIISQNAGTRETSITLAFTWRRGSESNRRVRVLQTLALPLGYRAIFGT